MKKGINYSLILLAFFLLSGVNNASAAACQANEKCMQLEQKTAGSDTYYVPNGYACVSRGACPGQVGTKEYQECCAPIPGNASKSTTTLPAASATTNNSGGTVFMNPLGFNNVESFLSQIMTVIKQIIVSLSLVFIVIGAVMYVTSGGSSGQIENAKKCITAALVGLALGVAAPSLLKELANVIGWGGASEVAGALTLSDIAIRVLNFLLGTLGIVALIMLVIGAMLYLTSAGDEDRIEQGKEIFKYSLIGVVIAMSSMILVQQVAKFFVVG